MVSSNSTSPKRAINPVWFVILVVVAAVAAVSYQHFRSREAVAMPEHLRPVAPVPQFQLTDQSGRQVTNSDLLGAPWVANFIFTRCMGPCPLMSARMSELARKLPPELSGTRLVSISVDPTHDTPEVLSGYAAKFGAENVHWFFLTGSEDRVRDLIVRGFLQPLAKDKQDQPMHSTRFVLVDGKGIIRGFREGNDPDVSDRLLSDLQDLRKEQVH